jgi:hypothetical protein
MNVTIQDAARLVGEAVIQAPDGTTFRVDRRATGAYRFEKSTFEVGPPPVPLPSIFNG